MTRFCPKCQAETERNPSNICKLCKKKSDAAYRIANKEKLKIAKAAYRLATKLLNPNKAKEYHVAWVTNNRDKMRAYKTAWKKANQDKVKTADDAYRAANRNKERARSVAYYAKNTEKAKASNAAWKAANPEARRIQVQNYRAKKRTNGGILSKGLAAKLFKLQNGKCPCCHQTLGDNYQLDHIVPIALGGSNTDDNIQLLRSICNLQKNAKHPIDFMQQRGFLL